MYQPKSFFRKFTKSWYVQIGKQQINLGRDKQLAFEEYHQLMAGSPPAIEGFPTVAEL